MSERRRMGFPLFDHLIRQRQQRRGHDQWLRHGSVGDLFSSRGGPETAQVEAADLRPRSDPLGSASQFEPWREHAGCLRTLAGSKQCDRGCVRHMFKRTL